MRLLRSLAALALAALPLPALAAIQTYYIHADHLNTPRLIEDQSQQVVWRWDNDDPFGGNMANENPSAIGAFEFNLRFPGQYFDAETSQHYNYYRDYSPEIGRYIQSDPIGLVGGINTYTYANGNPLSLSDPLGLNPAIGCAAGAWAGPLGCGVGATVGSAVVAGTALAAILSTPGDTAKTKDKDQCKDDYDDDCTKRASDWELKQAGIDPHEVKKGLGQVSLFEIRKCKSGGFAVKRKGCQGPIIFRL